MRKSKHEKNFCLSLIPVVFLWLSKKKMVTAISLLQVERDKINDVASRIAEISGVSEVYSVGGRYDLVAIIRVKHNDDLAAVVTEHIRNVEGIKKTETLLAFRAYSKHDLEEMFAIGME